MRWWEVEELDDCDVFDPVRVERSPTVEDDEAAVFEAICKSTSPGPFVIDDRAEGEGSIVATLPDGRVVVSLNAGSPSDDDAAIQAEANARLICEARCMILRLLRDREQWYERERDLIERVAMLEERLTRLEESDPILDRFPTRRSYLHPR